MSRRFPNEEMTDLQLAVAKEDVDKVRELLGFCNEEEVKWSTKSRVLPHFTALHIAARVGNLEILQLLVPRSDVNQEDQWGFTPLHYAAAARQKDAALFLLSQGASAVKESKNKTLPRDIAEKLKLSELVDALSSKENLENDETLPAFRDWLQHLGGGEYLSKFIVAGYDLRFIRKQGLQADDLDCVGVPASKMGLRRKLMSLHELDNFLPADEDDEDEEDDEEDDDEEEEEEEDD